MQKTQTTVKYLKDFISAMPDETEIYVKTSVNPCGNISSVIIDSPLDDEGEIKKTPMFEVSPEIYEFVNEQIVPKLKGKQIRYHFFNRSELKLIREELDLFVPQCPTVEKIKSNLGEAGVKKYLEQMHVPIYTDEKNKQKIHYSPFEVRVAEIKYVVKELNMYCYYRENIDRWLISDCELSDREIERLIKIRNIKGNIRGFFYLFMWAAALSICLCLMKLLVPVMMKGLISFLHSMLG